jgi:hypothetical protein
VGILGSRGGSMSMLFGDSSVHYAGRSVKDALKWSRRKILFGTERWVGFFAGVPCRSCILCS